MSLDACDRQSSATTKGDDVSDVDNDIALGYDSSTQASDSVNELTSTGCDAKHEYLLHSPC